MEINGRDLGRRADSAFPVLPAVRAPFFARVRFVIFLFLLSESLNQAMCDLTYPLMRHRASNCSFPPSSVVCYLLGLTPCPSDVL